MKKISVFVLTMAVTFLVFVILDYIFKKQIHLIPAIAAGIILGLFNCWFLKK